jgi:hypothetical protein
MATSLVPQIDLLAMHHGYAMTAEPWDVSTQMSGCLSSYGA